MSTPPGPVNQRSAASSFYRLLRLKVDWPQGEGHNNIGVLRQRQKGDDQQHLWASIGASQVDGASHHGGYFTLLDNVGVANCDEAASTCRLVRLEPPTRRWSLDDTEPIVQVQARVVEYSVLDVAMGSGGQNRNNASTWRAGPQLIFCFWCALSRRRRGSRTNKQPSPVLD